MTRSVEIPQEAVEAAFRRWNGMHVGTVKDRLRDVLGAALPYLAPADDGGNHHWDHDVQERPNAGPVHLCLTCPEKRACTGPSCGLHSILLGERTGENALAEWLEYVFTTNDDAVTWEAAAKELFDCGAIREPAGDEVVHLIADGEAVTSCCGRTPFELPRTDRITVDAKLAAGCAPVGDGGLREALERLCVDLDGNEWPHNRGCEGEPECAACWTQGIRGALAAHPAAPAVPQPADERPLRAALERYFSDGGPDTPIRTTWHESAEHWEAPAEDIRELIAGSAVPQPVDREALRERIAKALDGPAFTVDGYYKTTGAQRRREYALEKADAVLAVLAGEQEQARG